MTTDPNGNFSCNRVVSDIKVTVKSNSGFKTTQNYKDVGSLRSSLSKVTRRPGPRVYSLFYVRMLGVTLRCPPTTKLTEFFKVTHTFPTVLKSVSTLILV